MIKRPTLRMYGVEEELKYNLWTFNEVSRKFPNSTEGILNSK
jgi:hypothetical protein